MAVHKTPLRRRAQVAIGSFKAGLLPEGVGFIVLKPGYKQHEPAVDSVLQSHNIIRLASRKRRFTRRKVKDTYEQVFRAKPHLMNEMMSEFSSKHLFDKNIRVEMLYVPKGTVRDLKVRNAREAVKKVLGPTDPKQAWGEQKETGKPNIRGEAFKQAAELNKPAPERTRNVAHGPSPEYSVDMGWPTGFEPDLHTFVTLNDIAKARRKLAKLKQSGALRD